MSLCVNDKATVLQKLHKLKAFAQLQIDQTKHHQAALEILNTVQMNLMLLEGKK
jgi:hypothetical protein